MNNLNKENFFDTMLEKYPKAMKNFSDWIDDYKKETGWNEFFNEQEIIADTYYRHIQAPKFHDIPYEMQFGIILRYCTETFGEKDSWIPLSNMRELFERCLIEIDREI